MRPTYFASFLLGEQPASTLPSIEAALEDISGWLFENPYRELDRPSNWPHDVTNPVTFPDGEKLQLLRLISADSLQSAAVRFEHPDEQNRIWRTDCVIAKVVDPEPAVRFSVSVFAGSSEDSLSPVSPPSTRPRIVRTMMDKHGGRERYPLKATFLKIKAEEAEQFAGFLLDPERTLPIVLISRRNRDGELLCDPSDFSDKLVGIAYVCAADSTDLSWRLTNYIDNRLNTYDGSVRIYWPRMTNDDSPYRHRWWSQQRLATLTSQGRQPIHELLRLVATASVTRHVSGLVRWEDVEREITKGTVQHLQTTGAVSATASEEWLRQYELDLDALQMARQELADVSERLLEREEEVRQWKQMYVQLLRSGASGQSEPVVDDVVIEDADEAIKAAKSDFKGRLTFLDGRVEKDASQFEEPELLYAAFKWLATTYRSARIGALQCPDFDLSCREACQFRYNAHQSEITMSMFAADYEVTYNGPKVKLKEHIGFGTSTEPRRTIRIAFFFDTKKQKVVIGYVGQHQSTRRSN